MQALQNDMMRSANMGMPNAPGGGGMGGMGGGGGGLGGLLGGPEAEARLRAHPRIGKYF